jgi:hypothetical protein
LLAGRRHYFQIALWAAWLTVLWALLSLYMFHSSLRLPHAVQLAALGSAAGAFVGGCLGALYLVAAARSRASVISGVAATLINFAYFYTFVANPP